MSIFRTDTFEEALRRTEGLDPLPWVEDELEVSNGQFQEEMLALGSKVMPALLSGDPQGLIGGLAVVLELGFHMGVMSEERKRITAAEAQLMLNEIKDLPEAP